MNTYEVKYRNYWGNSIGYSTVEASSTMDAKSQVSKWGFVLECDKIKDSVKN